MSNDVAVRLLGKFSVTVDGRIVVAEDFDRRMAAELVQVLALAPGHRRHREWVFDALWPEVSMKAAANRLYQAATYARKALGSSDAVVLRGQVVALFPAREITVDAAIIESVDLDDPDKRAVALDAWGGELLPEVPYADWAIDARERLKRRYRELLAAGRLWRTIVELDPTDEGAHIALMTDALRSGDHRGVLRRFEELERVLADEVAVDPSQESMALRDRAQRALDEASRPSRSGDLRVLVASRIDRDTGSDGDGATLVLEVLSGAGGVVSESGADRLAAVFTSAADALGAAIGVQRAAPARSCQVAIDIGEVTRRAGSWSGEVTSRVVAIAEATPVGQIVSSSTAAALFPPDLGAGARIADLGLFRLPGHAPLALHQVLVPGVADESGGFRASRVAGRRIEPIGERMLGREGEAAALARQLEDARLVTVVGPGGVGKTHLACHIGHEHGQEYPGGAWLCELAKVTDAQGVGNQVLAAIGGLRHVDATVHESIFRTLADQPTLLVIDNCEHLLGPIGELCEQMLERCPATRILATSRQALGTRREVPFPLGRLDRAAAVELFVAEAARHGEVVDVDSPAIVRICERLDDLPLAVRLAAARVTALSVDAIEAMLDDRLSLRAVEPAEPAHHATLRSTIAWSVDALDEGQLGVLVDLAVFADRFTLDGAVAVARRDGMTAGHVLDHFDEVVRRSLVVGPTWSEGEGEGGYRLLESVRMYCRELGDAAPTERHFAYFRDRVAASQRAERDDPDRSHRRIRADWDDLRLAVGHAAATRRLDAALDLLAGVASFAAEGMRFEYLQWCESVGVGDRPVDSANGARAAAAMAFLTGVHGDMAAASRIATAAFATDPDDDLVIWAMAWIAIFGQPDRAVARRHLEALVADQHGTAGTWRASALVVLVIFDVVEGDDPGEWLAHLDALASNGAAYAVCRLLGVGRSLLRSDPAGAIRSFEEALAIAAPHDLRNSMAGAHSAIPLAAAPIGSVRQALQTVRHSLRWYAESGQWTLAMTVMPSAATALERAGRDDIAATILAARRASQLARGVTYVEHDEQQERLRDHNPGLFLAWWATGERLDPQVATSLALATMDAALVTVD